MQLNHTLATQITTKARGVLKREVLLTDLSGRLLSSPDNATHPGLIPEALAVAQTGHPVTAQFEGRPVKWWPFVYEDQTIAVFGLHQNTGPITQEAIALLHGLAEVIVYQHFLLDKLQSAQRLRADFLAQTLTSPHLQPDDIYRQADILQLHLRGPHAALLFHLPGLENRTTQSHSQLSPEEQQLHLDTQTEQIIIQLRRHLPDHAQHLIAYLGQDRFVILVSVNHPNPTTFNTIRQLTDHGQRLHDIARTLNFIEKNGASQAESPAQHGSAPKAADLAPTMGIGQYYPDLQGLRKSYNDAKLALEVGSKVWGPGRCYHIKQVGMFITLASTSPDRKAELAHQILEPLLRDQQLFKTVQAFLAGGLNLTEAAETLHIHRNTLIYRLDKTKRLIGLDPRHFDDALQIKLGLMFYQTPEEQAS